jgi:hypothetical protein
MRTNDPRNYFADADEANERLAFDADGQEVEEFAYREPDRFAEWEQWRAGWLAQDALTHHVETYQPRRTTEAEYRASISRAIKEAGRLDDC